MKPIGLPNLSERSGVFPPLEADVPAPFQNAWEFEQLLNIYKDLQPKVVVEIGVYQGGTLYQWIMNAEPGTSIIAIDPIQPNKTVDQWIDWVNLKNLGRKKMYEKVLLHPWQMTSGEAFPKIQTICPKIDFLFIDGDHSYEGAKQDFLNYAPLVRPGGIIAIHDINPVPPDGPWKTEMWKVWTEIRQAGYIVQELNAATDIYGIGIIRI